MATGKLLGMLGHGQRETTVNEGPRGTTVNGGPWHSAKIPHVQSLEPSQTSICRTISGMRHCWESCRQAAICVSRSWKSFWDRGPLGAPCMPCVGHCAAVGSSRDRTHRAETREGFFPRGITVVLFPLCSTNFSKNQR